MADQPSSGNAGTAALSVVVPVHNEADNIEPLVSEIAGALGGRLAYEIVCVDDGSTDGTWAALESAAAGRPELRAVRHAARSGQSSAIITGVRQAKSPVIATLDGDGQNDPADIPKLLSVYEGRDAGSKLMVCGNRASRKDTARRRFASRIANIVRGGLLRDKTPDTGCGLKVFARDDFLGFPAFDHLHRFMPALMIRAGGAVTSVDVGHRPRQRGASKYGVWDRLWVGIADLAGLLWLIRRPTRHHIDRRIGG